MQQLNHKITNRLTNGCYVADRRRVCACRCMMNTVASLASAGCLVFASSPESVQAAQYAPLAQMQVLPTSQGSLNRSAPASSAATALDALQSLQAAESAIDQGQFEEALLKYNYIIDRYGDFALAEYARIGKALCLYQVGRVSDALLLLEDEEVALRGAAQVHAALAALLYSERPSLRFRAEEEWDISQEFDKRYSDVEWVRMQKHWPPKALESLQRFLQLG